MKKKIKYLILLALVCVVSCITVFAASKTRFVDNADLVLDYQESEIESKLDKISDKYNMDFVVVTVPSLDGKTSEAYADDYFDYNGYGGGKKKSGVLLLVSMEDRDWAISTSGKCIKIFSDKKLTKISDEVVPYLSAGDYEQAFIVFAEQCEEVMKKEYLKLWLTIPFAIVIALILSLIVLGYFASKLKTVVKQVDADEYTRQGSLNLKRSDDIFINRQVRRHKIETSSGGGSSIHVGSSGRSHGGISGKF